MKGSGLKKPLLLVPLAFVVNLIFLYFYNPKYHFTISQLHGQIGYNVNVYGSINLSDNLTKDMHEKRCAQEQLVDFDHLAPEKYAIPAKPFVTNDTIGYGLILGLLWKITHSFSFNDVQWLQIILFSVLMILLFQIVFMLFGSESLAFFACIMHLFYFPILAMNVQPARDIWAYYGVVILLYGMLSYCFHKKSAWRLLLCGMGFGICQFVRPSVFLALLTLSFVFLVYGFIHRAKLKKISAMLSILWLTNMLCFWAPFMAYNKMAYDRYFVGPVGVDLLEGLGEFPNTWGYKLDDVWVSEYIVKKYQVMPGTPEFDDKAHEEFSYAFAQEPATYFINIIKRLPGLILPGLPWIFYITSPYGDGIGLYEKATKILNSSGLCIDFLLRHVYIRFYLLFGYLGAFFLLLGRRYWIVAVLFGVLLGGLGKLPSHIEYRYIVPYYWVFGILCAYALYCLKEQYKKRMV